ncbi:methylated-DNA--[protein]-cysteine S-methyltransferase [Antribacter sp. KLBMP9083]|uniref:Methylated-DNA--[protein]-cysteine S-methyltransferase n=1 Tax=Antribacter soli TaxID=2910976 RepID=A0AA41QFS8_9MICO|nr:methylated-DNA--[protein]-cysteine S-methyltransferase [Antribacter soli]MCF4121377.1 methylated-DNA--[protein]-cysteine S-methyltransferase [Antribacter soli]
MSRSTDKLAYMVFPTAIGHCALVWDESGAVVGSTLPLGGAQQVRQAVLRWYPGVVEADPPTSVADAAAQVRSLLDDGTGDLADVPLDMDGVPGFDRRVYEVVRGIPPGQTLTYGEVATRLGAPGAAQAVGQALGRNPFPPIVPCHRVLAAGRKVGGFSARGGPRTKLRMLETEGVYLEQPTLFDL